MTRATRAVIDLRALRHNLARVRQAAPSARVMAVVKSNGYGHGLVRAARAFADAQALAVTCLDEALELREAGLDAPIVLLEGFTAPADLRLLRAHALDCVIHHDTQLEMLDAAPRGAPLRIWLKVDTGMHRLGFAPARVGAVLQRLRECPHVEPRVRLITHLANADDRADPRTDAQVRRLLAAAEGFAGEMSIANSAGVLAWPQTHADWVRPGIMLYGVSPFLDEVAAAQDLKPAMTLHSALIAVNRFRQGDAIGYGGSWTCPEDMPVGVVAIGYGDGYPRHAPSGTPVLVNGRRVPLVGRVSMDMLCVDLRSQPQAMVGDPVVLWGEGLPVEEIARRAGTIGYELLCGVAPRVKVEVIG